MDQMKKRWISIYVENEAGVLARISGLFSGKCYCTTLYGFCKRIAIPSLQVYDRHNTQGG